MAETAPAQVVKSVPHRERRRKSRKSAEDLCLVTVEMEPAGFGLMLDVSESGLGVQVMHRIEPGTDVQIAFKVPELGARIEGAGVVSWCDGEGRVGISFRELKSDSRKELEKWINSLPESMVHEPVAMLPRRAQPGLREQVRAIQAQIAQSHLDVSLVLQFLVERVVELTHSNGGAIALAEGDDMLCRASTGLAPDVGVKIGSGSALTSECLRTGKIVRCDDTETDTRVNRDICRELNLRSSLIFPILFEGKVRGVLEVFSPTPKAFNEQHLALLQQLAEFTSQIVYGAITPSNVEVATSAKKPSQPEHTALSALLTATTKSSENVPPKSAPSSTVETPKSKTNKETATPSLEAVFASKAASGAAAAAQPARIKEPVAEAKTLWLQPEATNDSEAPSVDLLGIEDEASGSAARNIIIVLVILAVLAGLGWWYFSNQQAVPPPVAANPAPAQPAVASTSIAPPTVATTAELSPAKPAQPSLVAADTVRSPKQAIVKVDESTPLVIASGNNPTPKQEIPVAEAPTITLSSSASLGGMNLPGTASRPELKPQGVVTGGLILRRVEPVYPLFAKQQRMQGDLVLSARVTKDGSVDRIKRVSGNPVLEPAAIAAVRQWKYEPFKLNGQPQDVDVSITVQFRLKP